MTLPTCDLSGTPVQYAKITFPYYGVFHADVTLVTQTEPTGTQTLTFLGMQMTCSVVRAISFVGSRGVRLVGGFGGWRTVVPAKQFSNAAGLKASTVVMLTAMEVGEKANIPASSDFIVGTNGVTYARSNGKASLVLNDPAIFDTAWWMDITGTVQITPRPSTLITSDFVCQAVTGAAGIYTVATETPSDWLPGRKFQSSTVNGQINRVQHTVEGTKVRTEVMVS